MKATEEELFHASLNSPIGWIVVACSNRGIRSVDFCGSAPPDGFKAEATTREEFPAFLEDAISALESYFELGTPLPASIPLDESQGTDFQRRVWKALRTIPFGETLSYGDISRKIGSKSCSARAVGGACGRNPLPLFIPCHRVVGHNGKLTGFSAGLEIKRALLDLERKALSAPPHA